MRNPVLDIQNRRVGIRGASLYDSNRKRMRIIYRDVSWSTIKSKRFGFRVVRNA